MNSHKKTDPLNLALKYLISIPIDQLGKAQEYLDSECQIPERKIEVMFPVAFCLHALSFVDKSLINQLQKQDWYTKLVEYLAAQASDIGTFNYWIRGSKSFQNQHLPDDVDDVACAVSALKLNNHEVTEDAFLATINLETRPGGPYHTWYVPRDAPEIWRDVDPVVNAHFVYACGLYGITLDNTNLYLKEQIQKNDVKSVYYPQESVLYFYLARYQYFTKDTQFSIQIENFVDKSFTNKPKDLLELLLLSLIQLYLGNQPTKTTVKKILSYQLSDGSLPMLAMCHGYEKEKTQTYVGSKVLSTSLLLELLALIRKPVTTEQPANPSTEYLQQKAIADLSSIDTKLGQLIFPNQTKHYRGFQFPFQLAAILKTELSSNQKSYLEHLSMAMGIGWQAYTLLDDCLDDRVVDSRLIGLSPALRLTYQYLDYLPEHIKQSIIEGFNHTDSYYLYELTHFRINSRTVIDFYNPQDTYDYITQRMHVFLNAIKQVPKLLGLSSEYSSSLAEFFKHLFIIEQFNDDLHDWEHDFKTGIKTYTLSLLGKHRLQNPRDSYKKLVWRHVVPETLEICDHHYQQATNIVTQKPNLDRLLIILEKSYAGIRKTSQGITSYRKVASKFN